MPRMNGTGPEGKGAGTGRRLGKCKEADKENQAVQLGTGMGKRHKSGFGTGKGKRLQSAKNL